jgi:glycogen debranching enzyme
MTASFLDHARAVLAANDRGGYTVPTDRLYPFQWNWDSAFVAMGFATFDIDRALGELEALARGQWADGMIPQIIFHKPAETYFPGPDVWRTNHTIPTSGITQPPVFAMALDFIAARAGAAFEPRIAALYRAGLAYHRWWESARDPEGRGIVAVLHNWETGRDNSPEWDAPFARVPQTTTTAVVRRDTGHVDAAMRPRDEDYRRYIHLVDLYASLGWEPRAMWRETPFKVADIGINAILGASEEALGRLAQRFGTPAERIEIENRAARLAKGLAGLWNEEIGLFASRDLLTEASIPVRVSAGFLPLLTAHGAPATKKTLARQMDDILKAGILPVPSTLPGETGFEPKRYWRGPVWAVVNYLIARGFARHGMGEAARTIDEATLRAIREVGFCEYFDPLTREGLGGNSFSWTAAIALLIGGEQMALAA